MNFTKEQIEKAMKCQSVEELLALAKDENIAITRAEAEAYFAQLNAVEMKPEDIENIVGGCTGNACAGNISAGC